LDRIVQERAVFAANAILEHIRVSGKLVDVKKIARTWDPAKFEISIAAPHTQSWFDAGTGEGLAVFIGANGLESAQGIRRRCFSDSGRPLPGGVSRLSEDGTETRFSVRAVPMWGSRPLQ
jgi:hypothetical protein